MMIEGKVLIPGLAWWDNADEIWRKEMKEEYYPKESTQKEELELEKRNPLWFCDPAFYPDKIMDGVPYYAPRFYSDYFEGCFECYRSTWEDAYILLPFELNGKWGYVDEYSGEIVVQPIWDFAEPFCGCDAVVGKEMTGKEKACDIRCMKGDKVTIDDEPNVVLRLHNIVTGEIMEWREPRLKNETFCKSACTVHFGIIDKKGNLQCSLEPNNDYVTSQRNPRFFDDEPVTVTQKNGKFYIEFSPWSEMEKQIWEVDIIDAADENTVETKIADRLIFIQRNDLKK